MQVTRDENQFAKWMALVLALLVAGLLIALANAVLVWWLLASQETIVVEWQPLEGAFRGALSLF